MLAKTESVSEYFVIVELIRSNVHLSNEMILYRATQVKPCSSSVVFNQELQAVRALCTVFSSMKCCREFVAKIF